MNCENFETMTNLWDTHFVEKKLNEAFSMNSELHLLEVLKENSFLFQELVERQFSVQPIFHEVAIGNYKCDFAWLNDRSDGPEWVLVEIEKPNLRLFKKNGEPTAKLHHACEQVHSWIRYFSEYPNEKKRIFGAVARFRYIMVCGSRQEWETDAALKWRIYNNSNSEIDIRTSEIFKDALNAYRLKPDTFWSYHNNPTTQMPSKLISYWTNYKYFDFWRRL